MDGPRTGRCLCGAVSFTAEQVGGFGICHCSQCRKWTGAGLFGVTVPFGLMKIEGAENIRSFRSSAWASRHFCGTCGSSLWYRYDRGQDGTGNYEVAIGLLDDANGLILRREIFMDAKPNCYALEGNHPRLTEAELFAKMTKSAPEA